MKFRGAGHGDKALIAELVVGEIGRALGLPVPELVLASCRRRSPAANHTTRFATCSAGRSGSTSDLGSFPARCARHRAPAGGRLRMGRGRSLVRLADDESRSHAAQRQPGGPRRADLADRPRLGALRPPRLDDPDEHAAGPSDGSPSTSSFRSPARSRRPVRVSRASRCRHPRRDRCCNCRRVAARFAVRRPVGRARRLPPLPDTPSRHGNVGRRGDRSHRGSARRRRVARSPTPSFG